MWLLLSIAISIGLSSPSFAQRSLRLINPPIEELTDTLAAVECLQIAVIGETIELRWQPALRNPFRTAPSLSGYRIDLGPSPQELTPYRFIFETTAILTDLEAAGSRFFAVWAVYSGRRPEPRRLRQTNRDLRILLDFEDDLALESYPGGEDVQPNRWEISDDEALPGSERSLRLYGNTWKRMSFARQALTDSSVWRIGMLSRDADTLGEVQAFGIGDGANRLFYVFAGKRTVWDEAWMIANQDVKPHGRWNLYKMAVGYDWKTRYGYIPSIDELIFINDNDNTNPPSQAFYDDLIDLTDETLPEPAAKVRWRLVNVNEAPGWTVEFRATVDNRDPEEIGYFWDFGDGTFSDSPAPTHWFGTGGRKTVGLMVSSDDRLIGDAAVRLNLGGLEWRQSFRAAFVGDVMLARRYEGQDGLITRFGPEYVFEPIRSTVLPADLFVINLECPLTDEGVQHPMKDFAFRGRPENVAGLVYAGVDIAGLGNNHVGDFGQRGLEETMEVLDAAGILYTGAGLNEYDALRPAYKTVNGVRVGVLAFCNRTGRDSNTRPFLDAAFDRYGYAYFSADNLLRSVPNADENCDVLIVEVHGGAEYDAAPLAFDPNSPYAHNSEEVIRYEAHIDSATRELEHLAIDLGADLVVAHHPHVLQGFEIYNGVLIAHSMGNFAFDQNFWETWASAILWTEISREGVQRAWIQPVFVNNYRPTPAVGRLGETILRRLAGYSYDLQALTALDNDLMRLEIALDPRRVETRYSTVTVESPMRFIEAEGIWRSQPIEIQGDGFLAEIQSISPNAQDAGWQVALGRDILMLGNMESEGAEVWNYNSQYEGRDSSIVRSGRYSSRLYRGQNWRDAITDLTQRIPIRGEDRLTLSGWLRITNGRDAALAARYYRFRYDNDPRNILGDQPVEGRLQGDHDWTFLWDHLTIPDGAEFLNIRWQLFGPANGEALLWADDVALVKWDAFQEFENGLTVDIPNDRCYLQVQTRLPVERVRVACRTATLSVR